MAAKRGFLSGPPPVADVQKLRRKDDVPAMVRNARSMSGNRAGRKESADVKRQEAKDARRQSGRRTAHVLRDRFTKKD